LCPRNFVPVSITCWKVRVRVKVRVGVQGRNRIPITTPNTSPSRLGDITRGLLGGVSPVGEVSSRRRTRVAGVTIVEGIVLVVIIVSWIAAVSIVVGPDLDW
jgi:hypothetical protein